MTVLKGSHDYLTFQKCVEAITFILWTLHAEAIPGPHLHTSFACLHVSWQLCQISLGSVAGVSIETDNYNIVLRRIT